MLFLEFFLCQLNFSSNRDKIKKRKAIPGCCPQISVKLKNNRDFCRVRLFFFAILTSVIAYFVSRTSHDNE